MKLKLTMAFPRSNILEDHIHFTNRKNDNLALDEILKYNVRFIFELLHQKMNIGTVTDKLNLRIKQVSVTCDLPFCDLDILCYS